MRSRRTIDLVTSSPFLSTAASRERTPLSLESCVGTVAGQQAGDAVLPFQGTGHAFQGMVESAAQGRTLKGGQAGWADKTAVEVEGEQQEHHGGLLVTKGNGQRNADWPPVAVSQSFSVLIIAKPGPLSRPASLPAAMLPVVPCSFADSCYEPASAVGGLFAQQPHSLDRKSVV